MKVPSLKILRESLRRTLIGDEAIQKIREVLTGSLPIDKKLSAVDTLMKGHGVESFTTKRGSYAYINTGETYAATIIYKFGGSFSVNSWGNIVERDGIR